MCVQEAGVVPDQHIMGTLLGNAASQLDYEYLTALMKVRPCRHTCVHVRIYMYTCRISVGF